LEKAVRKLLVASQKSGVGKTTTSMNLAAAAAAAGARVLLLDADPLSSITGSLNLAEHPRRRPLREAGFDLPGVLVSDFVPGLDFFSPYEAGRCTDADLDELLRLVTSPPCQEGYGCLVVDTPPFLGAKPAQLVSACDEFVVVMRAEAMAYRTLPALLELVQRSRGDNQQLQMRGILLTLEEGEAPGGRWERELRGRFGNRVLPHVVPYDEAVGRELQAHQIVSAAAPEAPAAVAYQGLATTLGLAAERRREGAPAEAPLLAAAALFTPAVVGAKGSSFGLDLPETPLVDAPVFEAAPKFQPAEEPAWRPEAPEQPEPPAPERRAEAEHSEPLTGPKSGKFARPVLPPEKAPAPAVSPSAGRKEGAGSKAPAATAPEPAGEKGLSPLAFVWVGLAVAAGVGLRFVKLPDFMLPVIVGVAVTAAVVLALRLFVGGSDQPDQTSPARPVAPKGQDKSSTTPTRLAPRQDTRPLSRRTTRPPTRREE
jgi:chromosome partitioning protein